MQYLGILMLIRVMETQLTLKIIEEEINLKQNQCIVVRLLNLYYKFLLEYWKGGILLHNNGGIRGLFRILILRVLNFNRIFQLQS